MPVCCSVESAFRMSYKRPLAFKDAACEIRDLIKRFIKFKLLVAVKHDILPERLYRTVLVVIE